MNKQTNDNLMWKKLGTESLLRNEWINFKRNTYRLPDGQVYDTFYSYTRRDYVVIVASDEEGNYICVNQFRQGIEEITTEFPAGGIEIQDNDTSKNIRTEEVFDAAKRELREETGYESDDWNFLLRLASDPTISENYAYIFTAKNCRRVESQSLDSTEFVNVKKHSAEEIDRMIAAGRFQQAVHIAAWLMANR